MAKKPDRHGFGSRQRFSRKFFGRNTRLKLVRSGRQTIHDFLKAQSLFTGGPLATGNFFWQEFSTGKIIDFRTRKRIAGGEARAAAGELKSARNMLAEARENYANLTKPYGNTENVLSVRKNHLAAELSYLNIVSKFFEKTMQQNMVLINSGEISRQGKALLSRENTEAKRIKNAVDSARKKLEKTVIESMQAEMRKTPILIKKKTAVLPKRALFNRKLAVFSISAKHASIEEARFVIKAAKDTLAIRASLVENSENPEKRKQTEALFKRSELNLAKAIETYYGTVLRYAPLSQAEKAMLEKERTEAAALAERIQKEIKP